MDTIETLLARVGRRQHVHGMNLRGADLRSANLKGARMEETGFDEAILEGGDWGDAVVRLCSLDAARAASIRLDAARLEDSSARGADLRKAGLRNARLSETSFERANLRDACFDGATGDGIVFRGADLVGASFRDVRFEDADFRGADLRGADLSGAVFQHADFRGALLDRVDFSKAHCPGTSFDAEPDAGTHSTGSDFSVQALQDLAEALLRGHADSSSRGPWLDKLLDRAGLALDDASPELGAQLNALFAELRGLDASATAPEAFVQRCRALLERTVPGGGLNEADWQSLEKLLSSLHPAGTLDGSREH